MATRGKYWISDPNDIYDVKVNESGVGAIEPINVSTFIDNACDKYGNIDVLHSKRQGKWEALGFHDYREKIHQCGRALVALGIKEREQMCILGFNSEEWMVANLGAITANMVTSGIYLTNTVDSCSYVLGHSKAVICFTDSQIQTTKIIKASKVHNLLKFVVQWGIDDVQQPDDADVKVISFEEFMKMGSSEHHEAYTARANNTKPGTVGSLIYTSGTTGMPKGVMLTHDNMVWTAITTSSTKDFALFTSDKIVSFLPLSHIAGQIIDLWLPFNCGVQIYFADSKALQGSLVDTLKDVRPTCFVAVPRVWAKMVAVLDAKFKSSTGIKKSILNFSLGRGAVASANDDEMKGKPWGFWLANKLMFTNLHAQIGLDNVRYCISAAAPISVHTRSFLRDIQIPIMDIYGMSECTGPIFLLDVSRSRLQKWGIILPGTQTKIFPSANVTLEGEGEICLKGRHIFAGYMHNPEASAETIDEEGWMHSGDLAVKVPEPDGKPILEGEEVGDGLVRITGRSKELLITAGGENVAPLPIEDNLKKLIPCLSNVVVLGDAKKFLSAIFTLSCVMTPDGEVTDKPGPAAVKFAKSLGIESESVKAIIADPKVRSHVF
eukprot:TRINITY_DN1810_c0_g1_i1.p1 TRINITY_DN1810_c0_g1~~TRINITY_DN1810_c0_g1_i1.p1  ORF type:complete len:641 (+),score=134.76 TRINITY_DN1810_c0_g1_i1:105-1925(+)